MGAGERIIRIDTYASATGVSPAPQILALDELYALLEHEETDCQLPDGSPGCRGKKCPRKDGLAWSLGFIDDPCRCGGASRSSKATKRCGKCGKKTRFAGNVAGIDVAVFDIDHINTQQLEAMCVALEGTELYLHTTHSHKPPDDQGFRLVLPMARTVTPDEWKQLWFAIVRKFDLPVEKNHGTDKSTRDPARLSFFPRAFRGNPFINIHNAGQLLEPKDLLLENLRHSRESLRGPKTHILQPEVGSVDLKDLKGFLRRYDPDEDSQFDDTPERQKGAIMQRIINEEPLAEKGCRGLTMLRAGTIVGWALPIYTPVEAALELMRPSIVKMKPLDDDDENENSHDAWLASAQRGYEGAQAAKIERIADEESATGKLVAAMERKRQRASAPTLKLGPPPAAPQLRLGPPPGPAGSGPPSPPQAPPNDPDDDGDWRLEKMITAPDKQGVPHPKNTAANITVVLKHHRAWRGALRFNELTQEPEMHGGPLPASERSVERHVIALRNWLAHEEELDMPRFEVADHIEFVAREHSYDPLREEMLSFVWDGQSRAGDWLIKYGGAKTKTDDGNDVEWYVKRVGLLWLRAVVARALYPGCKADNVLILEGKQYVGKSKMLGVLGGTRYADTRLSLSNNAILEMAGKCSIIELPELTTMKQSETETQKAFFSQRVDNFRFSYGRRVGGFPRRCVFAGTTNETQYLLDLTGNRRYWCVWLVKIDIEDLQQDRELLMAEVVAQVRAGETCPNCFGVENRCSEHRWWMDAEETDKAESITNRRLRADYAEEIHTWWLRKEPEARPAQLNMSDVLTEALNLAIDRKEREQNAIGRAMKLLGFEKRQATKGTGREWVYIPSKELREAKSIGVVEKEIAVEKEKMRIAQGGAPAPTQEAPVPPPELSRTTTTGTQIRLLSRGAILAAVANARLPKKDEE